MFRLNIFLFSLLVLIHFEANAANTEVRFLNKKPSGCRDAGQVVGLIDKGIKDKWSFMGIGYAEPNSTFLQDMKKQARRLTANRIVISKLRAEYVETQGVDRHGGSMGVSYDFKNGTYIARAYYCK